jgi:hypothetical protein
MIFETSIAGRVSVAGPALKALGFYVLQNATTGAWMLASTSGGIIGGTATGIGLVAAVLMSPWSIGIGSLLSLAAWLCL